MLVITRLPEEGFTIGGDLITVKVLHVVGSRVYLGIDAPKELEILRDNVKNSRPKIKEEVL